MSRRTLLCEKLTGDTRSLIWTDSRGPGYRHDTRAIQAQHPGLTCSRKRTLFPSTVLAAVITVTAKYLSFVGSTYAWWTRLANMRAWPRPLALAQEASWARTTPPLFDFSVYRLAIYRQRGHQSVGRAVIHGSSSS